MKSSLPLLRTARADTHLYVWVQPVCCVWPERQILMAYVNYNPTTSFHWGVYWQPHFSPSRQLARDAGAARGHGISSIRAWDLAPRRSVGQRIQHPIGGFGVFPPLYFPKVTEGLERKWGLGRKFSSWPPVSWLLRVQTGFKLLENNSISWNLGGNWWMQPNRVWQEQEVLLCHAEPGHGDPSVQFLSTIRDKYFKGKKQEIFKATIRD